MRKKDSAFFLTVIFSFLFTSCAFCGNNTCVKKIILPPEMIGHWEGYGHEIVTWCEVDSVLFSLEISPNGNIEGTFGDATLKNGYIKKNSWLVRRLGNPEYLIGGDLEGPIVASENIYRKSLRWLIVDFIDGKFKGGFRTSGGKGNPLGNDESRKKSMKMSGVNVVLEKTAAPQ